MICASSHKPGCMRRSPASQSCTVRSPACTSAPKAVWDRPRDSRKVLMASGAGFEAPEGLPRLGCDAMSDGGRTRAARGLRLIHPSVLSALQGGGCVIGAHASLKTVVVLLQIQRTWLVVVRAASAVAVGVADFVRGCHFDSLAPVPEARRIRRIHDSNICDSRVLRKDYFVGVNPNPVKELKAKP